MKDLVLENERLIEQFNISEYLDSKLYQIAASLAALETTNEIAKSFTNKRDDDLPKEDHILRLYALLQGLFVSIDSLYALTLALTRSKSNINLNNNKYIRQIKYIRNDVVGHPSNRVLGTDNVAYCILDNSSIDAYKFSYQIYTEDSILVKDIILDDLLKAYYEESNILLKQLYSFSLNEGNKIRIKSKVSLMLDSYLMGGSYQDELDEVIKKYKEKYKDATKDTNRVIWRYTLINKLENIECQNVDEKELINYCIGLELVKIYELVTNTKFNFKKKLPKYVSSMYRFLKQNKKAKSYLKYLVDSDHPIFKLNIELLYNEALKVGYTAVIEYLDLIKKYLNMGELELVYALNLPIKAYNKK